MIAAKNLTNAQSLWSRYETEELCRDLSTGQQLLCPAVRDLTTWASPTCKDFAAKRWLGILRAVHGSTVDEGNVSI